MTQRAPRPGRQPGVALISALMVMVIMVIIATGFVQLSGRDVRSSQTLGDSLTTLHLAEAGIEYALWMNKHNMTIYPWITHDDDGNAGTANVTRGSIASVMTPTTGTAPEQVVINDLAFSENWLKDKQYCGTFQVTETIWDSGGVKQIRITSTGRVREVPSGLSWSTYATTPVAFTETDTASAYYSKVRSKRTLNLLVKLNTTVDLTSTNSTRFQEFQWYEQFR